MDTLYTQTAPPAIAWPEPIETTCQMQRRRRPGARASGVHRPDITRSMRLLVASIVEMQTERPHGMITWLAEFFDTSRQTVYTIGEVVVNQATLPLGGATGTAASAAHLDRNGMARAALTLMVLGAMRLRGVQMCLQQLLGCQRSLGWLSGLVDEAGERAGAVIEAADWSGAQEMIAARDELFFGDNAWLLTVDTRSLAIISAHVETHVDAETWGISLALDELRTGNRIVGLAEDAATWYPASVEQARTLLNAPLGLPVQKDVWHLLRHADQTVRDAERIALKRLTTAEEKASVVRPGFTIIRDFEGWEAAHARAERAIDNADGLRLAVGLLREALEIVDPRTGQILERETAEWYLAEIVAYLHSLNSDLAASLAGTIERQQHGLLCFHDWLALNSASWRSEAEDYFEDPDVVDLFERTIARAWHLERAVTNGHWHRREAARRAAARGQDMCQHDEVAQRLSQALYDTLDNTVRTSSACECLNSILRVYIWGRRHFNSRRTAQNWLNLLVLWHNMRTFQRGKRKGSSPFELSGVTVHSPTGEPTDDWLEALGYPEAA